MHLLEMMATYIEGLSMAPKGKHVVGDVTTETVLGGRGEGTTVQSALVPVDEVMLEVEDLGVLNADVDDWLGGEVKDAQAIVLDHTVVDVEGGTHLTHILVEERSVLVVCQHHLIKVMHHCAIYKQDLSITIKGFK